jgi:hypothetical protein
LTSVRCIVVTVILTSVRYVDFWPLSDVFIFGEPDQIPDS